MDFGMLGGVGGEQLAYAAQRKMDACNLARPATVRERLQLRLTQKEAEVADIKAALEALTTDIEKALDALARCGNF